jgi:hypothetical protein
LGLSSSRGPQAVCHAIWQNLSNLTSHGAMSLYKNNSLWGWTCSLNSHIEVLTPGTDLKMWCYLKIRPLKG